MAAAPRAIPLYFSSGVRKGIGAVVIPGIGRVDIKALRLDRAKQLWEEELGVVRLTDEGARTLYADRPAAELRELLPHCRTPEEIASLCKLKKSNAALQKAGSARAQELDET